jgi:FkbM family methyltransferase
MLAQSGYEFGIKDPTRHCNHSEIISIVMRILKSIYRRMRRAVWIMLGSDIQFPVQVRIPKEKHGSDCGIWWICPDHVTRDSIFYSFGIGEDITFEQSMIEAHHVTIHAFDPTPASIAWVKAQSLPAPFKLHETGIAAFDGKAEFFPPENPRYVSHTIIDRKATKSHAISVEVRRLSTTMRELGHEHLDILKMDVEGAEYKVLEDIIQSKIAIQQILVEFHHRFPGVGIGATRRAVELLNEAGYYIFAASPNGEEYSFIKTKPK